MKKVIACIFLALLTHISYAQKLQYGLSLGLNSSANYGKGYFENERSIGTNIGIKLQYELSRRWHLHSLIAYSQKGSSNKNTFYNPDSAIPSLSARNYLNLDYIDFPLLISPVLKLHCIKLYPMLGIDQGFLIRATNKVPRYDVNTSTITLHAVNLFKNNDYPQLAFENARISRYQIGIIGGIGIQFSILSKRVAFIETRCAYGLTPVMTTMTGAEVKNSVLSVNTGLLF